MSLILGVYSLEKDLTNEFFEKAKLDFSYSGKRTVNAIFSSKFILAGAESSERFSAPTLVENKNLVVGYGGYLSRSGLATTSPVLNGLLLKAEGDTDGWVDDLEGYFSLVVYKKEQHELVLCNDKFGICPFFIYRSEELLIFCNEFQPILELVTVTVNLNSVACYFSLGTTLSGQTFWNEIRNLDAGHKLHASNRLVEEKAYYNGEVAIKHDRSPEEHAQNLAEVISKIVREMVDDNTDTVCLLSGGADTRLIVSCLTEAQRSSIDFLTSYLPVHEKEEDRDVIAAVQIAEKLGLRHKVSSVSFSNMEFGPLYYDRERELRERPVIGGWLGGEFLGGLSESFAPIDREITFKQVDDKLKERFSNSFINNLDKHPFEIYQEARAAVSAENAQLEFEIRQIARAFFTKLMGGSKGYWLQPYQNITRAYIPFCDSRFIEALLEVPFDLIRNYGLYNLIYKNELPLLTDIPSNSPLTLRTDSCIPKSNLGTEAELNIRPAHHTCLNDRVKDDSVWKRGMYNKAVKLGLIDDENSQMSCMFTDFEAMVSRYSIPFKPVSTTWYSKFVEVFRKKY